MEIETIDRKPMVKKENRRSLNKLAESVRMNVVRDEPNKTTLEAIREAKSGKFAGTIDTSSMEAFIKSCE